MPDRVWFATSESTANPASCSGFNGMPFAITHQSGRPAAEYYPRGMSLHELVELFWRTRSFSCSGSVKMPSLPAFPMNANTTFPTRDSELELISSGNFIHQMFAEDPVYTGPPATGDFLSCTITLFQFQGPGGAVDMVIYDTEAGLYYPKIKIECYHVFYFPDGLGIESSCQTGAGGPILGTATIFGEEMSLFTGLGEMESCTMEIEPYSYWPYDADGSGLSPVWDAVTGAQLRDPRGAAAV